MGGIAAAILVAWIVAMFVIGSGIRAGLEQSLADAKAMSSGATQTIEITEYKKGIGSSTAKSKIALVPTAGNDSPEITLNHKISHGPILSTGAGLRFGASNVVTTIDMESLPPDIKENLERGFTTKTPLEIEATSGFSGATDLVVELAYYNNRIKTSTGSSRLEFEGLDGSISGLGGDKTEGEIKIGKIRSKDDDGTEVILEEGKFIVDGEEMSEGMMLKGVAGAEFPRLTIKTAENTFIVNDLVVSQQASNEGGKVTTLQMLKIGNIQIPDSEEFALANSLAGKGIEWGFKMGNMDIDVMRKISAESRELRISGEGDKAKDDEAMANVLKLVLEIIQPGTSLGLGIEMNGDAGKSTVNLDLQWVAKEPLLKTKDVKRAIAGLKVEVKTDLPASLAEDPMAGGMIQVGAAQGMLVVGEEKVTGNASLVHSTATLNGKTFPLEQMLGPFLEMPLDWDEILKGIKAPGSGQMPEGGAMGADDDELAPAPMPDKGADVAPATPDAPKEVDQ